MAATITILLPVSERVFNTDVEMALGKYRGLELTNSNDAGIFTLHIFRCAADDKTELRKEWNHRR